MEHIGADELSTRMNAEDYRSLMDMKGTPYVKADRPPVVKLPRPIGLAKDIFQVPPEFFDELPEDLLDGFEGGGG